MGGTIEKCAHYWAIGFIAETIFYCTKCNCEADEIYGLQIYRTHKIESGELKLIQQQ